MARHEGRRDPRGPRRGGRAAPRLRARRAGGPRRAHESQAALRRPRARAGRAVRPLARPRLRGDRVLRLPRGRRGQRLGPGPRGPPPPAEPAVGRPGPPADDVAQNLLRAAARNRPREASLRLCEWTRVLPKTDRVTKDLPAESPVVGLLSGEAGAGADPKGLVYTRPRRRRAGAPRAAGRHRALGRRRDRGRLDPPDPPDRLRGSTRAAGRRFGPAASSWRWRARSRRRSLAPGSSRAARPWPRSNLARVLETGRAGAAYRPPPRFP